MASDLNNIVFGHRKLIHQQITKGWGKFTLAITYKRIFYYVLNLHKLMNEYARI